MNQISLVGRLIADAESRFTPNGKFIGVGKIAVDRPERPKEGEKYPPSDIFTFEVWGDRGEALVNMTEKGRHIWVIGRLEGDKDKEGRIWHKVKFAAWGFAGAKPSSAPRHDDDEHGF